jgi:hypothetical protein
MADLLSDELDEAGLAGFLSVRPPSADLPPAGDPAWRAVRESPVTGPWAEGLLALAEDDCGRAMPELPPELYAAARRGADPGEFEGPYRERRRMLARAGLCALLFPEQPLWRERVATCGRAILAEPSWALPERVGPESGIDPLHLDPEAAATAFLLAQTVAAAGEPGGAMAGEALARLRETVFENYLARHGEFWWTRSPGHTNAVAHHGVLGAALAVEPDAGRVARMLLAAKNYLRVYLRGFGGDGASLEGVRRWEEGLGCFVSLNDLISARTIGQLALFSPGAGLHETARFGCRMKLSARKLVNFGDSGAEGSLDPGLLSRLAEVFADDEIAWVAERALADLAEGGIDFDAGDGSLRGWAALLLFAASAEARADAAGGDAGVSRGFYFPDAAILVVRGRDGSGRLWEFAAKGGHNAEPYNHNDAGSYLLDLDGVPVAAEIGQPLGTHDYFHGGRYDYLAARTLGHSLPLVNGFEQPAGPQAAARVLSFEEVAGCFEWSLDLSACYPPESGCSDLIRTFRVDPGAGLVEVREIFEMVSGTGYETAVIVSRPVIRTAKATLIDAGPVRVAVEPGQGTAISRVERHEYTDRDGRPQAVSRIVLVPEKPAGHGAVSYRFRAR